MNERDTLKARAKELKLGLPGNASNADLKAAIAKAEAQAAAEAEANQDKGANQPAQQPPSPPATAGQGEAAAILRVVGPAQGFRRAGFAFGREPVDLALADLSAAQIEAIEREPRLSCLRLDLPEIPPAGA